MKLERVEIEGAIPDRELAARHGEAAIVHIEHRQPVWWREKSEPGPLQVFLVCENARAISVGLLGEAADFLGQVSAIEPQELGERLRARGGAMFALDAPLALGEVAIPKAWGEELWFSGIEERGVATIADGAGGEVPLPWLLAATHQSLGLPPETAPTLLKILAPSADPVYGDLYFELHEKKREVYIVTRIDREAWPDGVGAIRMGFDADKRKAYPDDEAFRDAFLRAIANYEAVRRRIDEMQAPMREKAGFDERAPVPPEARAAWDRALPAALIDKERSLREEMNAFSRLQPLEEGDVVQIPTKVPHALQHGVRVVEFQTPDYERKIISFAQRVLNQSHWDSEEALAMMRMDMPAQPEAETLATPKGSQARLERLASFPDFDALRLTLPPEAEYRLDARDSYQLLIGVTGAVRIDDLTLTPEKACLLSGHGASQACNPEPELEASLLIARPSK